MATDTSERTEQEPDTALFARITRLEWGAAAVAAVVLVALAVAEPDIVEAPFENGRTLVFTFGGTAIAAVALVVMLRLRVHPAARLAILGLPFVAVSWWLLSPFFIDETVNDDFAASIEKSGSDSATPTSDASADAASPRLLGAGSFVGLAGHDGAGDAGFFALDDGRRVLRLENFDIDNGPDLRLYVVPGAAQTDPGRAALNLGKLRGNVGDQTYDLPGEYALGPGDWTVLVWCEAFKVEFVAATVTIR